MTLWELGPLSTDWKPPSELSLRLLVTSGALGLGVGDLFLLGAFVRLGVSRTLMLYGFQPLFLALAGLVLFGQALDLNKLFALATLIGCLLVFSLEARAQANSNPSAEKGRGLGLLFGLIGVSMDTSGVVMTRMAFETSPQMHSLEAHWVRCIGALTSYALLAGVVHIRSWITSQNRLTAPVIGLFANFKRLQKIERVGILVGCFLGTYLSLCLYLTAIQLGHLASISAIAITGPMFTAFLECALERKLPSRYLLAALTLFILGFFWL